MNNNMLKIYNYLYRLTHFGINTDAKRFVKMGGIIGKDCDIASNVEFGTEPYLIRIGNHVRITNGVRLITHDGGTWIFRIEKEYKDMDCFGSIIIDDNVHIGWNAIIMPNVHIGSNCVIGAGAIVTKDIPDNSVAVGVPAKVIETTNEYRKKMLKKYDYTKSYSFNEKKDYLMKKNFKTH